MQYTKPMIELVFEIRRRVPADLKPSIKLANPELLDELTQHHAQSRDIITQTLIKELLQKAGAPWDGNLDTEQNPIGPKQVAKVYRGQVTLEDAPNPNKTKDKPRRMYRGQVVEG